MPYLSEIRKLQVDALVECTPAFLGRDPWILTTLSENSGLHLLTNTGYYGAHQNHFLPAHFYRMSTSEIAAIWVDEFENGIEGSSVRPGFIKIGVDGDDKLSEDHRKIITAAALAHLQTGLVIASHTGPEGPAFEQIAVLQDYNIAPSSFIWVHAQRGSLEGNIKAAQMGAWISLDNVDAGREPGSTYDVTWYANRIKNLKEAGFLHRILISHDAGWYKPGEKNGGDFRPFTSIFSDLLPLLRNLGFSQGELDQILIDNPRDAFCIRKTS
jgi:phosphotriesterase-related protein